MATYKLEKIDTTPGVDPYHANTGGQTKTTLWIDPARRMVGIYQDFDDNATPSDVWHGLTLECRIDGYPDPDQARELLTDNPDIDAVIEGHSTEWDGQNMVGRLTDAASLAMERLIADLTDLDPNNVELWQPDDWFSTVSDSDLGIHPGMTDAEIEALAEKLEAQAQDENAILAGGAEGYIRQRLEYMD